MRHIQRRATQEFPTPPSSIAWSLELAVWYQYTKLFCSSH